jgi:uncharacterized protein GlcG (DUF336 family)
VAHCAAIALVALASAVFAQAPRPSYGTEVNNEAAKKIGAAAIAEATKKKWNVAVAIVDNHGMLIYYEMMDDTQTAGAHLAIEKARTAAMFRRPSKDFEDRVGAGNVATLGLTGAIPIDGGLPIMVGGKIAGGVGVSGMAASQDAEIVKAGLDAIK